MKLILSLIIFFTFIFFSCKENAPIKVIKTNNVNSNLSLTAKQDCSMIDYNEIPFINKLYNNEQPMVEILNLPLYTKEVQKFSLETLTTLHIYASGEIIFDISDQEKKHYLQSDDSEFYFKVNDSLGNESVKSFKFSLSSSKPAREAGNGFVWKIIKPQYYVQIRIPRSNLNLDYLTVGQEIPFDLTVGDNDDGYAHKTKIAWRRQTDLSNVESMKFGKLVLSKQLKSGLSHDQLNSILLNEPMADTINLEFWNSYNDVKIDNVIYGFVKDNFDLEASIRSVWDKDNIYFLLSITDDRIKKIIPRKFKERKIFVDYGWIENSNNEVIWEMLAENSKWSGGSFRNQKIDTLLTLMKGSYTLKYISDESHAFDRWIDCPPLIPFYGVKIFESKVNLK